MNVQTSRDWDDLEEDDVDDLDEDDEVEGEDDVDEIVKEQTKRTLKKCKSQMGIGGSRKRPSVLDNAVKKVEEEAVAKAASIHDEYRTHARRRVHDFMESKQVGALVAAVVLELLGTPLSLANGTSEVLTGSSSPPPFGEEADFALTLLLPNSSSLCLWVCLAPCDLMCHGIVSYAVTCFRRPPRLQADCGHQSPSGPKSQIIRNHSQTNANRPLSATATLCAASVGRSFLSGFRNKGDSQDWEHIWTRTLLPASDLLASCLQPVHSLIDLQPGHTYADF